jgi:ATP-binding cassette subfamily B protein
MGIRKKKRAENKRKRKLQDENRSEAETIIEIFQNHAGRPGKIMAGIFKGQYLRIVLSGLSYIVKHSAAWVMPIMISRIITNLTLHGAQAWPGIIRSLLVLLILVLLNIPFNYLHVHFRSRALRSVESKLRLAIVEKLQLLSIPYHHSMQSGRLQSKMIRDVEAVQTLSEQLVQNTLNIGINITVALIVTAKSNLTIFAFFLVTIPFASLLIRAFRRPIEEKNQAFRREMEKTSADFAEMEEMITVTRAHALEKVETERIKKQADSVAQEGYRLDIIQANFGSVSWAIFQCFQLLTLGFSAYLSIQGRIPVGNLVLYQSYFTTLVNQVTALIALVPLMAKGFESIRSLTELFSSGDVEEYEGKEALDRLQGQIRFEDLSFTYPGESDPTIQDLNLDVKPGQSVAFVGESGSGKSTIMNLLIGFLKADQGHLWIDGIDSEELDFRSFRKQISVVPQDPILFSATLRENITYGNPHVTDEALDRVIRASSLEHFVASLEDGLDTYIHEGGSNLSGGQRQRIAIARALIRNPRLIIFDEATSALDSISEKQVLESLDHLIQGRTSFIVAHRISTIRKADKICVLDQGRIVEEGTYDELMARKGLFAKMQSIQAGQGLN